MTDIRQEAVNAIRILSADTVQKANSGHPGMPLGAAPAAYELWSAHMKHDPKAPEWYNRDRFVLSSGHASALLYSLLHLFGYGDLSVEDLKSFRQLGSLTPGHPEYKHTAGVEATTGPLGAGLSMAVGMAVAEAHLAEVFNRENYPVFDHYTYVMCGDGCMMEGISSEAMSLAGTLGLGKLIVLYDSNRISIEGSTDIAFTENVQKRFEAFGFQLITVEDGTDLASIGAAIEEAKADTTRPSLITVKTQIGYGCPAKQGKAVAHGEPLGPENVAALRENLGWQYEEAFYVPEEIYAHYRECAEAGAKAHAEWEKMFCAYFENYPEMKTVWEDHFALDIDAVLPEDFFAPTEKAQATRASSGVVINKLKDLIPGLMGGSADLAPSNKTNMKDAGDFSKEDRLGRNMHFGVRELAMTGIVNGMMLHGGLTAYGATFFVFADYMKPMMRLAAIMKLPSIYVLTHDSIGVGEDGPTHEPIEQLASLRATPGINVFRPADDAETAAAWYSAVTSKDAPTVIALTRQNLTQLGVCGKKALKGAYILKGSEEETPDVILIATGSEVAVALGAADLLAEKNVKARVVSMPCMELFEAQSEEYKESVIPKAVRARVCIEAGSAYGWEKYAGLDGAIIAMHGFGASAPYKVLFPHFGFTPENAAAKALEVLNR